MSQAPDKVITVTTSPTKLLSADPHRYSYEFQNQGAAPIYIGNSDQVATSGTRKGRILMSSALEYDNVAEDPKRVRGETWAVVAAGTCDVWVGEETA